MPAVAQRVAPLLSALDDEIAHNEALFARLNAVWEARAQAGLTSEKHRLLEVLRKGMQRRGAGLAPEAKTRLAQINARLASLSSQYNQILIFESTNQAVFIDNEADLEGLPEPLRQAAAAAAAERGRPDAWAIANARGAVWPFLTLATRRDLRQAVWRMWTQRGDNAGPQDNKPIAAEILQLCGELARLMGFESYAHFALADRMARTPETALDLLERTWHSVKAAVQAQVADYQTIADSDLANGQGARFELASRDRQFYAEKLRREGFGLDGDAVKAHLPLDAVLQAMFWAAGRVHGLVFKPITGAPSVHPMRAAGEGSPGTGYRTRPTDRNHLHQLGVRAGAAGGGYRHGQSSRRAGLRRARAGAQAAVHRHQLSQPAGLPRGGAALGKRTGSAQGHAHRDGTRQAGPECDPGEWPTPRQTARGNRVSQNPVTHRLAQNFISALAKKARPV